MVRRLAERACYLLCLGLGRLLRSGRYARARIVLRDGERAVRKQRLFYAPLLIWMGRPLMALLDTGVRILPQREWEERERHIYRALYQTSVRIDVDGALLLPCLAGATLADWLQDPACAGPDRKRAIELAVSALGAFHRAGFTHGDAMADNVLVDPAAGVARWFDFETVHDAQRPRVWRRADDVRALLVACLIRTAPQQRAEVLSQVLDVYADADVTRVLAESFGSVVRPPLVFHLAQASVSLEELHEIARLLDARGAVGR